MALKREREREKQKIPRPREKEYRSIERLTKKKNISDDFFFFLVCDFSLLKLLKVNSKKKDKKKI
jgi:hypothetical protein